MRGRSLKPRLNAPEGAFRDAAAYDEPRAAQRRRGDAHRPAVGLHDLLDDGQPEPAAAGVAGARLVEPDEPLEDPLALVLGDPGAVVLDDELHGLVSLAHRDHTPGAGVPRGVVDQVAHHLRQRRLVAADPRRRRPRTCRRRARRGARGRASASTRSSRSTSAGARSDRALVGPGQQQQLLDQPLHPLILLQHASASSPSGSAPGCARATSAVWRISASGERSSWEASATNCRCRSWSPRAGQHLVHGQRQAVDLVARGTAPAPAGPGGRR